MSGTKEGSIKATATILARNPNHFKEIGRKGGLAPTTGGFYRDYERARAQGSKGGKRSKVGYKLIEERKEQYNTILIYKHKITGTLLHVVIFN